MGSPALNPSITKALLIGLLLIMAVACNPGYQSDFSNNRVEAPAPGLEVPSPTPDVSEIRIVEQVDLWRTEEAKGANTSNDRWKDARIRFSVKEEIKEGEIVTVVPLDVAVTAINVSVAKATKAENPCNNGLPEIWEVELQPITGKEFLEARPLTNRRDETPFEVCVIYPAIASARQLRAGEISKEGFPAEVSGNLTAAIDLTNDLDPDVLVVRYCCVKPAKGRNEDCEYICGKTYLKRNGEWRLIDTSTPC